MAQKHETVFIRAIHSLLPKEIHREKMANPYRGGTWDCWYDGPGGDLWIEYKWAERIPGVLRLGDYKAQPALSDLQQRWGKARHANGRRIAVVLGMPYQQAVIFTNLFWQIPHSGNFLHSRLLSSHEVCLFIEAQTLHSQGSAAWKKHWSHLGGSIIGGPLI